MARARRKPHVCEHVFYTEPYVLGHRVSRIGQLLLPKSTRSGCPASTRTFMKAACRQRGGQGRRQDLPQQHRGLGPTLAVHTQGHAATTVPSTTSLLVRAGATTEAQGPFCSTSFSNLQPCASSQHCLQNPAHKRREISLHLKRSRLPWLGQALHILLLRGSTFLPFFFFF